MTYIKYRAKVNLVRVGYKVYNRPLDPPGEAGGDERGAGGDSRVHNPSQEFMNLDSRFRSRIKILTHLSSR